METDQLPLKQVRQWMEDKDLHSEQVTLLQQRMERVSSSPPYEFSVQDLASQITWMQKQALSCIQPNDLASHSYCPNAAITECLDFEQFLCRIILSWLTVPLAIYNDRKAMVEYLLKLTTELLDPFNNISAAMLIIKAINDPCIQRLHCQWPYSLQEQLKRIEQRLEKDILTHTLSMAVPGQIMIIPHLHSLTEQAQWLCSQYLMSEEGPTFSPAGTLKMNLLIEQLSQCLGNFTAPEDKKKKPLPKMEANWDIEHWLLTRIYWPYRTLWDYAIKIPPIINTDCPSHLDDKELFLKAQESSPLTPLIIQKPSYMSIASDGFYTPRSHTHLSSDALELISAVKDEIQLENKTMEEQEELEQALIDRFLKLRER